MKYFKNVKDLKDLKKQFKKLAMEYHPDRPNGNAEIMKAVNNEYDELFPIWKNKESIKTDETSESTRNEFYEEQGWTGDKYDGSLTIKDISALVKKDLKIEFPDCKFSVTKKEYTGGGSITVALMEAPKNVFAEGITEVHSMIGLAGSSQLNEYGNKIAIRCNEILDSYNFDKSDIMTDYFHVNFYGFVNIGKWNKPFKVVERKPKTTKKNTKKSETTVNKNDKNNFEIVENIEKHGIELYFDSIPDADFRNLLKTNGFRWNRSKKCWYVKKSEKIINFLNSLQSEQLPA